MTCFICTVFQSLVYFIDMYSQVLDFSLFQLTFFWSVRFWKKIDEIILQSISESRIWFPEITSSVLIIKVSLIEGWFLIDLIFSVLLKTIFSWVGYSTVTAPWLSKTLFFFVFLKIYVSAFTYQKISQIWGWYFPALIK